MEIPFLVRKLNKRLLIAFFILAMGMLYFSGKYLYEAYETYHNLHSAQQAVDYFAYDARLIQAVQKERGLTLACALYPQFCGEAALQRHKTEQERKAYYRVLQRKDIVRFEDVDRLLNALDLLDQLRIKSEQRVKDPLKVFEQYSQVSRTLIRSINPILEGLGDRTYLGNLLLFKTLLDLIELEGRERALLMSLHGPQGKNPKIEQQLRINDERLFSTWKNVHLTLSKEMAVRFRRIVPFAVQRHYEEVRRKMLKAQSSNLTLKRIWWKTATDYINRLYRFENQVLKSVNEEQASYLQRMRETLFEGMLFLGVLLLLLAVYMHKIKNTFAKVMQWIGRIAFERRLASIYGDFSENSLQIHSRSALFYSLAQAFSRLDIFDFLYLEEEPGGQIVVSENIPVKHLENKPPALRQAAKEALTDTQYRISSFRMPDSGEEGEEVSFGVFPILEHKAPAYLLYLVLRKGEHFDETFIATILRMIEVTEFVLERMDKEQSVKKMKNQLRIYRTAFDAQEAILITDRHGEIVEVNAELADDLQPLAADPFGAGWMIRISISNPDEASELIDLEQYEELLAKEKEH